MNYYYYYYHHFSIVFYWGPTWLSSSSLLNQQRQPTNQQTNINTILFKMAFRIRGPMRTIRTTDKKKVKETNKERKKPTQLLPWKRPRYSWFDQFRTCNRFSHWKKPKIPPKRPKCDPQSMVDHARPTSSNHLPIFPISTHPRRHSKLTKPPKSPPN